MTARDAGRDRAHDAEDEAPDQDAQRLDLWLWHARFVRTRRAAAELAASGKVRVNGQRVTAASRRLRRGDVVTVFLGGQLRIVRVEEFAARRGSPEAAAALWSPVISEEPT